MISLTGLLSRGQVSPTGLVLRALGRQSRLEDSPVVYTNQMLYDFQSQEQVSIIKGM